ncbi:hypothetical protein D9757_002813 [Collybiopsis confluens]|uniref:Ribosome biogenesis protein SLX9 n=1 Tax=Collybiopsis confluens TaxID=2823264 RepID=A0A8H5HVR3_9AGAR|nr:hypothetical protein D9757_002813 [Collybiopsis confluens]
MPKERSKRSALHNSSVKLRKTKRDLPEDGSAIEKMVDETRIKEPITEPAPTLRKKDKQQGKREAFLQRLELTQSPYSKSHQRRLKRRLREQIGHGLDDIRDALQSVDPTNVDLTKPKASDMHVDGEENPPQSISQAQVRSGQIGAGKGTTLSGSQRKKALKVERLRHPLILSNPRFSSNPFEAIRKHAQNTLIKHEAPP